MAGKMLSITIGEGLTKICEMEYKAKVPKVYRGITFETPKDVLEDGKILLPDVMGNALLQVFKENDIHCSKLVFTVATSRLAQREVLIPPVKEKLIQGVVDANASEYFPVNLQQYKVSWKMINDGKNREDKQMQMLVLAMPLDIIESYFMVADYLEAQIVAINHNGEAIYQMVHHQGGEEKNMFVNLGETFSTMLVLDKDVIQLQRSVSYGVKSTVETFREGAENIHKFEYLEAIRELRHDTYINPDFEPAPAPLTEMSERENLNWEVTESLRYLVNNIRRVVDYYNSNHDSEHLTTLTLCGTGANLAGLDKLIAAETDCNVQILNQLNEVVLDKNIGAESLELVNYLGPIGGSICPFDFIPDSHKAGKQKKAAKPSGESLKSGYIAIAVGVAVALGLTGFSSISYFLKKNQNAQLEKRIEELTPIEEVYDEYNSLSGTISQLEDLYNQVWTPNEDLLTLIKELEEKLPSQLSVRAFTTDSEGVTMTMSVASKDVAAKVFTQLRTFSSLRDVTSSGISEVTAENGATTVELTVTAQYARMGSDVVVESVDEGETVSQIEAAEEEVGGVLE